MKYKEIKNLKKDLAEVFKEEKDWRQTADGRYSYSPSKIAYFLMEVVRFIAMYIGTYKADVHGTISKRRLCRGLNVAHWHTADLDAGEEDYSESFRVNLLRNNKFEVFSYYTRSGYDYENTYLSWKAVLSKKELCKALLIAKRLVDSPYEILEVGGMCANPSFINTGIMYTKRLRESIYESNFRDRFTGLDNKSLMIYYPEKTSTDELLSVLDKSHNPEKWDCDNSDLHNAYAGRLKAGNRVFWKGEPSAKDQFFPDEERLAKGQAGYYWIALDYEGGSELTLTSCGNARKVSVADILPADDIWLPLKKEGDPYRVANFGRIRGRIAAPEGVRPIDYSVRVYYIDSNTFGIIRGYAPDKIWNINDYCDFCRSNHIELLCN